MPSTAREHVVSLLAAQDEVASSVQVAAPAPDDLRVDVEGIGRLTLPAPAAQARKLRALGHPARFGRGEETLTDAEVRDTWEIPTELVRVEWADGLGHELDVVREELGLPERCRLTAELHSMLVYEKGQFFLPHQDSEKDDAMIATLVVTLPSAHSGGELVVHRLGEATSYQGSKTRLSLVAFYADVRHEILPVTSGYRISLTYNLLLTGDPAERVTDDATAAELAEHLREHFSTGVVHPYRETIGERPDRLVVLLDHEYTERGLTWSRLKGTDATRAALLRAAADAAGCETVLALTEINETWDVTDPDEGYQRGRRGYRRWDYDDTPASAALAQGDDSRYELNDLLDSSVRLTRWTDPSGTTAEDVSLAVADAEVCTVTPTSETQPYSSDYEGYMGNYGNTLDRWYRRAAVIVWPQDRSFTNRAEASPSWAMDDLLARAGDPTSARAAAATLAPFWDAAVRTHAWPQQLLEKALPVAAALEDSDAAALLLRPFTVETLRSRGQMPAFAHLTRCYGEEWTAELLRAWADRPAYAVVKGPSRQRWITYLPDLCEALLAEEDAGTSTARRLLGLAWDSLPTLIGSAAGTPTPTARRQGLEALGEPLAAVISAAAILPAADVLEQIVAFCGGRGDAVPSCVVAALRASPAVAPRSPQDDALAELAAAQTHLLRARLARPIRAADDWSMELPDGAELPVTHLTRHKGSPFTLVLTKGAQLFEREVQQRERDQSDLDWLLERWVLSVTD